MRHLDDTNASLATLQSPLDIDSLWNAYHVSRGEEFRNKLLVHYLPLARTIARHLFSRLPAGADIDDLTQAATLGMRDAIATFDPTRGIKFEHFCGQRVRGAALDHLRSLDWAPRMLRSRLNRVQEMTLQLEMQTGATPTDEEISSALHMPLEELHATQRESNAPTRIRFSDSEDGENSSELDSIADEKAESPFGEAERADVREFLVRGLSRIERLVTQLYYFDDMSFREIGETLDLCESRVSQIHQTVLGRLRERVGRIGGESI